MFIFWFDLVVTNFNVSFEWENILMSVGKDVLASSKLWLKRFSACKVGYRQYCESRFFKLIGKATIFNEENKEYALNRCKEIWVQRYPTEPFENESDDFNLQNSVSTFHEYLLKEVSKQRHLYTIF
ncbi:hypothetical protein P3L10_021105 [Capsicum annuum]